MFNDWDCVWVTRKGSRCSIPTESGRLLCHVHDPEGEYARQHPGYRAGLLGRMALPGLLVPEQPSEKEPDQGAYWRELVQCHSCRNMVRRAYGPGCHLHGGGRRGRRLAEAVAVAMGESLNARSGF